jgi:hypothetical protein
MKKKEWKKQQRLDTNGKSSWKQNVAVPSKVTDFGLKFEVIFRFVLALLWL